VKLFIDASVALAAAGQKTAASRAVFDAAPAMGWELQASNYSLRVSPPGDFLATERKAGRLSLP
jgi:hypothetical protein